MLSQDGHMTVALGRSVISTMYLCDYCVASGFDRYGHTKSDSESDGKYGLFLFFAASLGARMETACSVEKMDMKLTL